MTTMRGASPRAIATIAAVLSALAAMMASCSSDDDGGGTALPAGSGGGSADASEADAPQEASGIDAADGSVGWDAPGDTGVDVFAEADAAPEPCPGDMLLVEDACVDRYEAPNRVGELPLVMYNLVEADAWCSARGKRLCYDDEWQLACEGPEATKYPYGDTHQPGTCNDDETWLTYNQSLLNGWPGKVSSPEVESLDELLDAARAVSAAAASAADHVEWLYQGEPAGDNPGCAGSFAVEDLTGNVEEWTLRRDGGTTDFHGSLKGRYWAESRTCQSGVISHGDYFRFYEIGFRCCADPHPVGD